MEKISILRAKKRDLEEKLASVNRLISAYEALEQEMKALLGEETQDVAAQPRALETNAATQARARSKDVVAFEAAVREILVNANAPIDRESLLSQLRSKGVEVGGAEPLNTLGARVYRMDDVSSRRGEGYFLKSREAEFFSLQASPTVSASAVDEDISPLI